MKPKRKILFTIILSSVIYLNIISNPVVDGINKPAILKYQSEIHNLFIPNFRSADALDEQVSVKLESYVSFINQDIYGNITIKNNRMTPQNIITVLKTDSDYLFFSSDIKYEINFTQTLEADTLHTFHFILRATLPATIISGVQQFTVSAYYEEVTPTARLSEPINVFLTVMSSFNVLQECLSRSQTGGSISDPQYDNFTITSTALGAEHLVELNLSNPFRETWFFLWANGILYSDPENDTIIPIARYLRHWCGGLDVCCTYTPLVSNLENYGLGFRLRSLSPPNGFIGAIYKLEMSLYFGPGEFWNDSRIVERGRTQVALSVKIGYDTPIDFGNPVYKQEEKNLTVDLPIIQTNSIGFKIQSTTAQSESVDTLIYGIFDFATNDIFQALTLEASKATFKLAVPSALSGNLKMVAIALTATAILIVYLEVSEWYQEQRTSGNVPSFDIPIALIALGLLLNKGKKCLNFNKPFPI